MSGTEVTTPQDAAAPPTAIGRVGRHGLYNLLRLAITIPVFLALTPFMLQHLGEEAYGAWALVVATIAVTALGDLGISVALVRYIAVDEACRGGHLVTLVNTTAMIYLAIAASVFAVIWAIHPWLLSSVFHIPAHLLEETRVLLLWSLAAVLVNFVGSAYYTVLLGLQRFGASNLVGIGALLAWAAVIVLVLLSGWGLAALALAAWAQTVATAAGHAVALRRYAPALAVRPKAFRRETAGELVGFSSRAFVGQLSEYADYQMDKLILGYFIGTIEVGVYHVAATVGRHLRMVPLALLNPLLPAVSELVGREDREPLVRTFHDGVRYTWAMGVVIFTGAVFFAQPFMWAWLGGSYGAANIQAGVLVLQVLAVAFFVNVLTAPYTFVMLGLGEPGVLARAASVHLVLNVVLSFALVIPLGLAGVVLATLVANLVGLVWVVIPVHRRMGEPLFEYVRLAAKPAGAAGLGILGVWLVLSFSPDAWSSLLGVLAGVGLFTTLYLAGLYLLKFLRPEEVTLLRGAMRRALQPGS